MCKSVLVDNCILAPCFDWICRIGSADGKSTEIAFSSHRDIDHDRDALEASNDGSTRITKHLGDKIGQLLDRLDKTAAVRATQGGKGKKSADTESWKARKDRVIATAPPDQCVARTRGDGSRQSALTVLRVRAIVFG